MSRITTFSFVFSLLSITNGFGIAVSAQSHGFALHDITLIDGTGTPPRPHQMVVVQNDRITQIASIYEADIPANLLRVDCTGTYLIPGLIDLHVHFPPEKEVHRDILFRLLEHGITTILNPGARPGSGVALRDKIRRGELQGPQMYTAGRIIEFPPLSDDFASWAADVNSLQDLADEIAKQTELGVDFIKIYQQVPPSFVAAAIAQAHQKGIKVIGHLGATPWAEAAQMGIDMLVHSGWGTPMDDIVNLKDPAAATDREWYLAYADAPSGPRFAHQVDELVRHGTVIVPTLSITQAGGLGKDASLLPQFETHLAPEAQLPNWWDEGWQNKHPQYGADSDEEAELMATVYIPAILNILNAYYRRGVNIAVGTDVGNSWMTPGSVYHHELELYSQAGIPPLEIIKMATHNGAKALGILNQTGTIEVGKRADLIVLAADPTQDIRNTRKIDAVILAGQALFQTPRSRFSFVQRDPTQDQGDEAGYPNSNQVQETESP